jgi:hypothetical protein
VCGATTPRSSSAAKLRAGNAGSHTATDHIEVLTEAIAQISAAHRKQVLIRSDGAGALTGRWPNGMRVIVRRERPCPGAQLSLFEERDDRRYQAFVTNTTNGQLALLEARHQAHARVEDRIRHAKDTGLAGSRFGSSRSTRPD